MVIFQKAPRIVWPRETISTAIERRDFARKMERERELKVIGGQNAGNMLSRNGSSVYGRNWIIERERPMKQPITVDLSWSSRAFTMGLGVGVLIGGLSGVLFGIWLFNQLH